MVETVAGSGLRAKPGNLPESLTLLTKGRYSPLRLGHQIVGFMLRAQRFMRAELRMLNIAESLKTALTIIPVASLLIQACERQEIAMQPEQLESESIQTASYPPILLSIARKTGIDPRTIGETRALPASTLQKWTEEYLHDPQYQGETYRRLLPVSDLVSTQLIAAFERDDVFIANDPAEVISQSPAEQALQLLDPKEYPELKRHLLHWAEKGDGGVLKTLSLPLASCGSDDLFPAIRRLFEIEDESVVSGALSGAYEAVESDRAEPEFRKYLWEICVKRLAAGKDSMTVEAISLMQKLDPDRAIAALLDPSVMRADHPLLDEAILSLRMMGSLPAPEFLHELLDREEWSNERQKKNVHRAAIWALVDLGDPEVLARIEFILSQPTDDPNSLLWVWTARFRASKLEPMIDSAIEASREADGQLDRLSPEQREVELAFDLENHVNSFGLANWYAEGHGRFAPETISFFNKIGATQHAELLEQATRVFGWRASPTSAEKLRDTIESMSETKLNQLEEIGETFLELPTWQLNAYEWDWERQHSAK